MLQAVPEKGSKLFEYGSVEDWLWKGNDRLPVTKIETVVEPLAENDIPMRYCFKFTADKHRLKIVDEVVEDSSKEKYQKSETKLEYSDIILENLDPKKVYDKSVHFQKLQQALEDLMR